MAKLRIKAEDTVVVISGKDKGKTGRVLRVDPKRERVYVEGLNIVKRHQKPVAGRPNLQVGVIEKEGPIHVSNVALADPRDGRPSRIGTPRTEGGRPIREGVYAVGFNIVNRHQRPVAGRANLEVGVIEREGPIHVPTVALADPRDGRPSRIGIRRTESGRPIRVAKRSGTEVD